MMFLLLFIIGLILTLFGASGFVVVVKTDGFKMAMFSLLLVATGIYLIGSSLPALVI